MVGVVPCVQAQHNTLIPAPQNVKYHSGSIGIGDLQIKVSASAPAAEDEFAAQTLRGCLAARSHKSVSLANSNTSTGKIIKLIRTGPIAPLAVPGEKAGPDSPQAYTLTINESGGEITAATSAGLYFGVQTVCQLIEGEGAEATIPHVEIKDWPTFAYRGVMVDCSHGPLPTEEEFKRQLDFLSLWKTNQYFLYSEAAIELDGFPLLNPGGQLSKAEVRRIIAYGRERHIDVIPNLELYGHLHDLFRIEKYSELADQPNGVEFDPSKPKVQELLANWIAQFSELFPSPFVHVGFDEAFQIGPAAKRLGVTPAQLYVKQLTSVAKLFQEHGKNVIAYSDMMIKIPEIIPQLPPGVIADSWRHYADKDFSRWVTPLAKANVPVFIQPGVTGWFQIFPDYDRSFANIDGFIAEGRKGGVLGVLTDFWCDDSQVLMRTYWPGMAYGTASAWQSQALNKATFFDDYTRLVFPAAVAADVSTALKDLTSAETTFQKMAGQNAINALWADPFSTVRFSSLPAHREDFRQTRLLAEDAQEKLQHALQAGGDPVMLSSFLIASRMLDYAGMRYLNTLETVDLWKKVGSTKPEEEKWWNEFSSLVTYQNHSLIVDMVDAITELRPEYQQEWLAEYRPYRLASTLGRWDAEYQYWRNVLDRIKEFSDGTRPGQPLPAVETVVNSR